MALGALQAQLACLYGPGAARSQTDFAALGGAGSAACAAGPSFPPGVARPAPAARWIASDLPPVLVQPWPPGVPVPPSWHEVDDTEARRLQGKPTITVVGGLRGLPDSSRLAALSTADSLADVIAARRPGRTPREARFARVSRLPRLSREARLPRPARAPRMERRPRRPRRARSIRPIRPPRPKAKRTKYDVGVCKRPACTCWTPAGCAHSNYWIYLETNKDKELLRPCFPGPCYDYVACVTHQCISDVACAVHQIMRFWARQYQAVAVWVDAQAAPLLAATGIYLSPTLSKIPQVAPVGDPEFQLLPGEVADGCPPGTTWRVGLTGYRCDFRTHYPRAATRAELEAAGVIPRQQDLDY